MGVMGGMGWGGMDGMGLDGVRWDGVGCPSCRIPVPTAPVGLLGPIPAERPVPAAGLPVQLPIAQPHALPHP